MSDDICFFYSGKFGKATFPEYFSFLLSIIVCEMLIFAKDVVSFLVSCSACIMLDDAQLSGFFRLDKLVFLLCSQLIKSN